ncbi:MAG TPA: hypothetical protein PKE05_02625, partial [Microthrixaceae bacterium]|nr:hypothetical protein [Microthrixaceae bacterium]
MRARPTSRTSGQVEAIEDLVAGIVLATAGALVGTAVVAFAGAQVAAVISGGGAFDANLGDGVEALVALPGHLSDPADAWPHEVRHHLPGP